MRHDHRLASALAHVAGSAARIARAEDALRRPEPRPAPRGPAEVAAREAGAFARAVARANPAGWTLSQFDPALLAPPGSTFLAVGPTGDGRLSVARVDGSHPGALAAIARADGECRVDDGFVLPLSGPLVGRHPALLRLAALACRTERGAVDGVDFDAWADAVQDLADEAA